MRVPLKIGQGEQQAEPARASLLQTSIFYGTVGLLLFGPLAFGAVEPWAILVLEAGAAVLMLLWAIRQAQSGELRIANNPLFPPMLAFAFLVVLQLAIGRTTYRYETIESLRLYCAYGALCFLMVQTLRHRAQLRFLAVTICAYGSAVATFALLQGLSGIGKIYWFRIPRHGGWVYGPYVNHNHYAGLMELLMPVPLVLCLTRFGSPRRRALATVAAALMAATIFLSGSRGGMLAFALQMAVLVAVLVRRKKGVRVAAVLGIFLVVMIGLATWAGGGELGNRLATIQTESRTELSSGMRLQIVKDGRKMFSLRPLLGWGMGVFPTVYPEYRSFYTNLFVNEAHNDYLQLLVEMGAAGFAVMLWFLTVVYSRVAKKLADWRYNSNGTVALMALLACTGILGHSFVDFNLQIPANAALFYVLCTVAAMESRFAAPRFRTYIGHCRRSRIPA